MVAESRTRTLPGGLAETATITGTYRSVRPRVRGIASEARPAPLLRRHGALHYADRSSRTARPSSPTTRSEGSTDRRPSCTVPLRSDVRRRGADPVAHRPLRQDHLVRVQPSRPVAHDDFPDGTSVSRTYDEAGQLSTITDERNETTTFAYDDAGRVKTVLNALGGTLVFAYDDSGNMVSARDERGFTTGYTWDAVDRLDAHYAARRRGRRRRLRRRGRSPRRTRPAGGTRWSYDAQGNLTEVYRRFSQVTSYTYDEVRNLVSQTVAGDNHQLRRRRRRRTLDLAQTARRLDPRRRRQLLDGTVATSTDFLGARRRIMTTRTAGSAVVTIRRHQRHPETTPRRGAVRVRTDARGTTSYTYVIFRKMGPDGGSGPDGRELADAYEMTLAT